MHLGALIKYTAAEMVEYRQPYQEDYLFQVTHVAGRWRSWPGSRPR